MIFFHILSLLRSSHLWFSYIHNVKKNNVTHEVATAIHEGSDTFCIMSGYVVTIQMKATEEYFPVVLFIMLCKVVLTFESLDEILKCDHSNESYWAVLSCGTVY